MGSAAFGLDQVVSAVVQAGGAAAAQATKGALVIFGLLFTFHLIEGASELAVSPSTCRLWHGKFWLRILLVAGGLAGYQTVVTGTVAKLQPVYMTSFAGNWATSWEVETAAIAALKKAQAENEDLKGTEVTATKAGKDDDSWFAKLGKYVVDGLVTAVGWVLAMILGLLITVFMLMEGFTGLGLNTLLVAVGPICVAFAAHEKTESYFWGFLKAFVFVGLLYMPILGLACQLAGVVMAHMTAMVTGSGMVYGDGTDIGYHIMYVVIGPLCAFAVVRSAHMFLGTVLGAAGGGGSGGMAMALGAAAGRAAGGVGGGGGGSGGVVAQQQMQLQLLQIQEQLKGLQSGSQGGTGGESGPGSVADLRGDSLPPPAGTGNEAEGAAAPAGEVRGV